MKKKDLICDVSNSFKILGRVVPSWLILSVIVLLASFLRLYKLDSIPASPYWEETALGYDAFSISKTGKDFHGNSYPLLSCPSFGDYKPSGYFYVLAPVVHTLGLNIFAVRLPSAVAGIISTTLLFFIAKELFDEQTGIIASAVFAVSPWSLQFSRGGWEVNLALMFVILGGWLLLVSRRRSWALPLSVLALGVSMYTYHAARVYAPLIGILGGLLLLRIWWQRKMMTKGNMMIVLMSFLLALGIVLPLVINLKSSSVSSRFDATSVFTDPTPVLQSNKQIVIHGNTKVARIMYHRYWFYGALVLRGYIAHFSPSFLFLRGDGNLRHSTVSFGLLYPLDAFFILLSVWYLVSRREKRLLILVLCVLFAGIAPALVAPTPHALRFLFALPGFTLLTAYGIREFTKHCRFNEVDIRRTGLTLLYAFLISAYLGFYYRSYAAKSAGDWQYGYKQMYEAVARDKKRGEDVYITREQGRPSMYYLFYSSYDPQVLQQKEPMLPKDQLELLQVDDYHFVDSIPQVNGLFVSSVGKVDPKAQVLDTIKSLDSSVVWVIWRRM